MSILKSSAVCALFNIGSMLTLMVVVCLWLGLYVQEIVPAYYEPENPWLLGHLCLGSLYMVVVIIVWAWLQAFVNTYFFED